MAIYRRVFPYVAGTQTFTMPYGYDKKVTYHVWAGGGGAGGDSNDIQAGSGTAGTYTTGQFYANPGDQITVVTGQGGQEGIRLESNKKLFNCAISGNGSGGVGPTASYGWVNDPTVAAYPEYNSPLGTRTFSSWTAFMNAWAVSDLANNQPGTEEVYNDIYFPEAGSYTIQIAGDNSIDVWFRDQVVATKVTNFKTDPVSKSISVPSPGVYQLRYILTNLAGSSGNPAGAAIVITKSTPGSMGGGAVQTYPGGVSTKNIIWSTRYGRGIDVSNRVPIVYAPVVNFYQPQSGYDYGGIPDCGLVFVSATSTWTSDELAKLNLSLDRVITISYPVKITGVGNIDQVVASGYYTFSRGQTWQLARYNWLGNPGANTNLTGRGSGTPANWTEKQWYNDNRSGRSNNVTFASWELPVPADNQMFIVGYADGVIYNAPSQRGSDNVRWTANSTFGQQYAGGQGGASAKGVGVARTNFFGGWGGQIGSGKTSGGGGGGGGASLLLWKPATASRPSVVTIAGGGAGGGGAGFTDQGSDGHGEFVAGTSYPNTAGAGLYGTAGSDSGGGGGGGGGGVKGGRGGAAANQGNPPGRGGDGAYLGQSTATITDLDLPTADFVMIGRGGDGGNGGGGGGAGELLVGRTPLRRSQYIQVGGAGGERLEGGPSAIWWDDATWVAAGPGGRGGQPDAAYGRNGNGQNGGCINGDTGTSRYGGSGGGGGTNPNLSSASGGGGKSLPSKPSFVTISGDYYNGGGSCGSGAGGGGGGASGGGSGGGSDHRGGNGGPGRTVTLGSSGKIYRLGGGGGGAAPNNFRGGVYIGLGQDGGGDGNTGAGPAVEFREVKSYSLYVPRNTTTLYIQGIAGGGGGGSGATRGSGGGGSGGYLPQTSYTVKPGQRIDITVGAGGSSAQDGGNTTIKLYAIDDIPETVITLTGGKAGRNDPSNEPAGGAGGSPNGGQGQSGNQGSGPFAPYSGRGADSPYGGGGDNCQCDDTRSKPSSGNGYGSGGGGGASGRSGGLGAQGYVRFDWVGGYSVNAVANTGSGGGGGFDGGSGQGASGFVAIAYPGEPVFNYYVDGRLISPVVQNGWTVHECYSSGWLNYGSEFPEGRIEESGGVGPAGTGVTGYISGSASGGFGHDQPSAYPISPNSQYPAFLNQHGVWGENSFDSSYVRTYTLAVPVTTTYLMKCAADNGATVKINDKVFFDLNPPTRDNNQYWWRNVQELSRTIEAGIYTLSINAQNISGTGAFALTIAYNDRQNDFIFNSRTPPVTGGSATGGNGLVILEFQGNESTAKVKQNDYWKKLLTTHVKVGGTWKVVPEAWVKIDGQWLPLYGGGGPITPTINTSGDVYGPGSKP